MPSKYYPNQEAALAVAKPSQKLIYWTENEKKKQAPNPKYQPNQSTLSSPNQDHHHSDTTKPASIVVERFEADQTTPRPVKGEKQYRDFLLQSLGVTSLLLAMVVCYFASLPSALAEEMAFTAEEVESFAGPGARLLAKSKISDEVRSSLVNSGDYIGLGTAAVAYVYRILSLVREGQGNGSTRQAQGVPSSGGGYQQASSNGANGNATDIAALASWGNHSAG